MSVRNAYRFESLPVWTDQTRSPNRYQMTQLRRKRRAVMLRDEERAHMCAQIELRRAKKDQVK